MRRAAGRVERVELLRLGVPDDREQIATDAVHRRLDDGEDAGGGDCSVDGVAAVLQDLEARSRRQRLARRDHAVARDGNRSRAAWIASRTVARCLCERARHDERRARDRDEKRSAHGASKMALIMRQHAALASLARKADVAHPRSSV